MTNNPSLNEAHRITTAQLDVPNRLLLGPGPSNTPPRILQAMSLPTIGHLDPRFIHLMNEIQELLRYAWQRANEWSGPAACPDP